MQNDWRQLNLITNEFFKKHWGVEAKAPEWNDSWNWFGPVPNFDLGGLYALFSSGKLVYIGLGNSRGGGIYKNHGISRRLIAHVLVVATNNPSRSYELRERWKILGVDKLVTIGFPADFDYLSPALEDFLIGKLNPPENSIKRTSE